MDIRPFADLLYSEILMLEQRLGLPRCGTWTFEHQKALNAFRIHHKLNIYDGLDNNTARALESIVVCSETTVYAQSLCSEYTSQAKLITPHFTWDEFKSRGDSISVPAHYQSNIRALCHQLEIVRKILGNRQIHIVSGWRSPWWNSRIGGYSDSAHLSGLAVDFTVDGLPPSSVRRLMESLMEHGELYDGGLGRMAQYTHYDIAQPHKRWN